MRVEEALDEIERRIAAQRRLIDAYYGRDDSAQDEEMLWLVLEALHMERDMLRAGYARQLRDDAFFLAVDWRKLSETITEAFAEIGRKLMEFVEQVSPVFQRLVDAANLTGDALKRLAREGEASRKPGPRQLYRRRPPREGPLGARQYRYALPATRRPWLRGFQRPKGKA